MPRAGGVYTLPAGNPVVTLTVISSGWANSTMSDIASALTGSLPTDGSAPMTGVLRLADGAVGTPGLTFATEPSSGLYRIGAGSYGFSVLSNVALSVNANRAWTIPATTNGSPSLTVNGTNGNNVLALGSTSAASSLIAGYQNVLASTWSVSSQSTDGMAVGSDGAASLQLFTNSSTRLTITAAGNVTIAAPSSGATLTATAVAGARALVINAPNTASNSFGVNIVAGTNSSDQSFLINNAANTLNYFLVSGDGGVQVGAPTGGSQGIGTLNATGVFINGVAVGLAGAPQTTTAISYTLVLADANKSIRSTGNTISQAFTIPANSSVAFPIGTIVTFCNRSTVSWQININTDILLWAATGGTGARALASAGMATAIKTDSNVWMISGSQLT